MVLTKEELISSLRNEIRILTHLCGKVEPSMLDYRPTPKQRSLIELLRYLTVMGPVLVPSIKGGVFLADQWNAAETRAKDMDFATVVKNLESQADFYSDAIGDFSEAELRGEVALFGPPDKRGSMLVNVVLCGHAGYRMQLFCYLKACGHEELNTMNLWLGVDGQM